MPEIVHHIVAQAVGTHAADSLVSNVLRRFTCFLHPLAEGFGLKSMKPDLKYNLMFTML